MQSTKPQYNLHENGNKFVKQSWTRYFPVHDEALVDDVSVFRLRSSLHTKTPYIFGQDYNALNVTNQVFKPQFFIIFRAPDKVVRRSRMKHTKAYRLAEIDVHPRQKRFRNHIFIAGRLFE